MLVLGHDGAARATDVSLHVVCWQATKRVNIDLELWKRALNILYIWVCIHHPNQIVLSLDKPFLHWNLNDGMYNFLHPDKQVAHTLYF